MPTNPAPESGSPEAAEHTIKGPSDEAWKEAGHLQGKTREAIAHVLDDWREPLTADLTRLRSVVEELQEELRLANRGKEAELREAVEETTIVEAAADEIDRLRTQNAALAEALEAVVSASYSDDLSAEANARALQAARIHARAALSLAGKGR